MYLTSDASGIENPTTSRCDNLVMYSSIKRLETKLPFHNFGVKYVMEGEEIYRLKDEEYVLQPGEYLLTNHYCEGGVLIDSKSDVKGICIDVRNEVLTEVLSGQVFPDEVCNIFAETSFFTSADFMEKKFGARQAYVGKFMLQLENTIKPDPYKKYQFSDEFYYHLCENIIKDYVPVLKQLQSINSKKISTKKEILKKVELGKKYLDSNIVKDINIADVAMECCMSEYHFFRLFRQIYGQSPYQYLKDIRLHKARNLLQNSRKSLEQVAFEVGYGDVYSLSKAYKQYFGLPPGKEKR